MKQSILSGLILILFPLSGFPQISRQQALLEIESLVNDYAGKNDIPTINLGIAIDDEIHFISYGIANREVPVKTSEISIFQIASVGKLLCGIIINDLVLQGKIDANASIQTYLPDTYSKRLKSKLNNISIRDLLHHRSGLPHQSIVINRKNDEPIIYDYTEDDFELDFEKMKLKSQNSFSYSNFGYAVLGYIAERVSEKSYEELLMSLSKEYGMRSTSTTCKDESLLVTPYREDDREIETKNWSLGKLAPPSGIYSSVFDLSQLLSVQLEVYRKNEKKDKLFLTDDTRDAWEGTGISYGYGMFDWGNGGYGHGGGMDGYGSEYWLNPEENVGFVLLTSSGGSWIMELSKKINEILIATQ